MAILRRKDLGHEVLSVALDALDLLGPLAAGTSEAISDLIHAKRGDPISFQLNAAMTLGKIGGATPAIVDHLFDEANSPVDGSVRLAILETICRIGVLDERAFDRLLEELEKPADRPLASRINLVDKGLNFQIRFPSHLVRGGPACDHIFQRLVSVLNNPTSWKSLRCLAASSLAAFGAGRRAVERCPRSQGHRHDTGCRHRAVIGSRLRRPSAAWFTCSASRSRSPRTSRM